MEDISKVLRVHINFYNTVQQFIMEYEKLNGLRPSSTEATKIIDSKIKEAGGFIL